MQYQHPVFLDVQTVSATDDPDQALIPELAEIVCLSYWTTQPRYENGDGPVIKSAITHEAHPLLTDPVSILERFASFLSPWRDESGNTHLCKPLIVWNSWTIETLLVQCALREVPLPRVLDLRYWMGDVVPLKTLRDAGELSLMDLAKAYRLTYDGFFGLSGGEAVAGAYQTDPDAVVAYSRARLFAARELYKIWARTRTFVPAYGTHESLEPLGYDPGPNPVYTPDGTVAYLGALGYLPPEIEDWPDYSNPLGWRELIESLLE